MTIGLTLYRFATRFISLFSGIILRRRVAAGKEDKARLNERRARNLPPRAPGPLVWLHGASVGECLLLLALGNRLLAERPNLQLLFTSQTLTAARLLDRRMPERARHQMTPLDSPSGARRFIRHWQPDLCIFAEGDIWPNLVREADASGAKLALVNARMTETSLKGWSRWKRTARRVFDSFDLMLAADPQTAAGLTALTGRTVACPGNLKSALPPPTADPEAAAEIAAGFLQDRACLLAASTHPGEEALVLEAWQKLEPRPALIIAPRHPERGDAIAELVRHAGASIAQRSKGEAGGEMTDVLLADTLGEMGLWLRLASKVYLGGGHTSGVGGHNPLEPLKLGKRVITGPDIFNFKTMMHELAELGAVQFVQDASELAEAWTQSQAAPQKDVEAWLEGADQPMEITVSGVLSLLEAKR